MKIEKVAMACHKGDLWLAKISIASVRYWYPEIKIQLYKDLYSGEFSTKELEKYWGVEVRGESKILCGSPLTKLHIMASSVGERVLVIDTDTVFAGKVLDYLETFSDDVVVSVENNVNCHSEWFSRTYYDYKKIKEVDPCFCFPGFSFNTGQLVLTTGIVGYGDLSNYVDFRPRANVKNQEIFKLYDQGLLNYIFPKQEQAGSIKIGRANFMRWMSFRARENNAENILDDIRNMNGLPVILHWAGTVHPDICKMPRSEIMVFFQKHYYSKIPFGQFTKYFLNKHKKIRYSNLVDKLKKIISCGS